MGSLLDKDDKLIVLKYTIYEGEGQIEDSEKEKSPMKHLDPFVTELNLGSGNTYRFLLYGTPQSLQRFDNKSARAEGLADKLLSFQAALFTPSKFGNLMLTSVRERTSVSKEGLITKKILPVLGARFKRKLS